MSTTKDIKSKKISMPLFVISFACCLVIFVTDRFVREKIELNKQATAIKMITTVMPIDYDNDLYNDRAVVAELSTTVYRARKNDRNVGIVFMPISTIGYKDTIKLSIGLAYDGTLRGVRVIEQNETAGLGDNIHQDKSDWIRNFDDRSLTNTVSSAWAVTKDQGEFDQISGATISPRSVINAVKNTLDFYEINRDSLYK